MRLVKQSKLVFQEGRSDKVYEIDLCEVGQDRFVVNFRYGRRGANLKEGTKTEVGVVLAEAERAFDKLVAEKTKKGYRDAAGSGEASEPSPDVRGANKSSPVSASGPEEARKQAILNCLQGRSTNKKSWSLNRVIWRAGLIKIKEASPFLVKLIGSGNQLRDYGIAWALGNCGDTAALPALNKLYQKSSPQMVRRIAAEALLKLSDEAAKREFCEAQIDALPAELSFLARQGSAEAFEKALTEYLETGDQSRFEVLETIYLIDNGKVRPALLNLLRNAPLKPNYFRAFRYIFKAAEYRRDAEVFGWLAYRFEKCRANFSTYSPLDKSSRYGQWVYIGEPRVYRAEDHIKNAREEILSPTSRLAYGSRTRLFLRKRVWRTLRQLAEIGDLDYVKMAVGVLLPYSDADAHPVKETLVYDSISRDFVKAYWDSFADYWAFNHLLYSNSTRYFLKPNSKAWRCRPTYKPGDQAPSAREEAYPQMWEKRPQGLLHLIAESQCKPVLEFATRALNACEELCWQLDGDTILMILGRPYECTARLGYKLALQHHKSLKADRELTLALANCMLEMGRITAHSWIRDERARFMADSDFLTALVFSDYADTRDFTRELLRGAQFSLANAETFVDRLITRLCTLDVAQTEMARHVAEIIDNTFAAQLRSLELQKILKLLAHPMLEVQELGGNILLRHEVKANDLPEAIINSLIASPFEPLRQIGIKLFGQIDAANLIERDGVIAAFAMHELEDIRQAIRPVIRNLCHPPVQADPRNEPMSAEPVVDLLTGEQRQNFSLKVAERFLRALFEKEQHAGVHSMLVKMMREDLSAVWMQQATTGMAWKLIHAKSQAPQELGGILLEYRANTDYAVAAEMDFADLVELSNHDVLAVRQTSWMLFSKMLHRLQQALNPAGHTDEMAKAVKLLDARWDDSRDFWFKLFDVHFGAQDFTPGILVSVCDSVRPEVQAFGRKLITRFFAEADGQEYLLKLSEHPTATLQTFATNYLERFAADSPERLKELRHYFLSVLSRVNKARVAKNRVLAFLTAEAQKSEEAARIVAEILTRQSATLAISDKAATIEAMLKIKSAYPHIALPIQVNQPEVRHAF
jgi:predicted DNA-binding WGR domain protein